MAEKFPKSWKMASIIYLAYETAKTFKRFVRDPHYAALTEGLSPSSGLVYLLVVPNKGQPNGVDTLLTLIS